jgi:rRNA maturation endonuclease Nob1
MLYAELSITKRINNMSKKYDIVCEECDANFDVLSDLMERADYCPFCGEFMPIDPDGWDEEEDVFDE